MGRAVHEDFDDSLPIRDILTAFIFYPIIALSNARVCQDFGLSDENIETAFTLAWDAIKL